ncbi:Protease Do-like 1, chloroplastic [Symbiodinium microadriaticum]|uniref:Protease Do-like 1, chloroplastic n=1 Tax=Symbiodinium microadriaticum TaxID=2951 RepID=A0A1Q9CPB6_SYMMI|nr:Protease Do-like 1, chloroplastic [Symbiodinium microadriaticum]CAE7214784.1 DEGP1 [Symbiodinium microadriaticum]CAE7945394.1 DEGP1 [Symbiodinium sp. KB8]
MPSSIRGLVTLSGNHSSVTSGGSMKLHHQKCRQRGCLVALLACAFLRLRGSAFVGPGRDWSGRRLEHPLRRQLLVPVLELCSALQVAPALALSGDEQLVTSLFERVTPGVVSIAREAPPKESMGEKPSPGIAGSGFVWDKKHVVTNYHVINELQTPYVTFLLKDGEGSKRLSYQAQVVGYDATSDVAVLEVGSQDSKDKQKEKEMDIPRGLMQPLARGRSDRLLVGQNVFAFGNPFGLEHSLSRGIISGVSRRLEGAGGRPISGVIQTDASINPGNSGGPLLNSDGEVIGVNTAILSGSGMFAGVGLAIPIDTVYKNVESIISKGFVKRPLLGLVFAPDVMDQELQLNGIMVMKVIPDGPAASAGVRAMRGGRLGDVVVAMDGKRISSTDDLFGMLEQRAPGDTVKLTVQRPSADVDSEKLEELDLSIKLGQAAE